MDDETHPYVRSGRSTPMTFPYNRGWETQPNSRGFIFPTKGWMTFPNTRSLDPGSYKPLL